MIIPRRELNGILMFVRKLLELKTAFEIPHENIFLHNDSIVCLYWVKKELDQLTVYVKNRVNRIKEARFDNQIYYTNSEDNVADLVSKVKPISAFLENKIWENGPSYMENKDWREGRTIQEIHNQYNFTSNEEDAIQQGTKKDHELNINLT